MRLNINQRELEARCKDFNLTLRICSPTHWQIRGPVIIVNYYPSRGTVYINGARRRCPHQCWDIDSLIGIAIDGPRTRTPGSSRQSMSRMKKRLFKHYKCCCWCYQRFSSHAEATVEHILPLSRGGSNRIDNLRLSCPACNKARGSSIHPPPPHIIRDRHLTTEEADKYDAIRRAVVQDLPDLMRSRQGEQHEH